MVAGASRVPARVRIGALAATLVVTLAGCSSSDGSSGAGGGKSDDKIIDNVDLSGYNGTDAKALELGDLKEPAKKDVSDCTVGFLQAFGGQSNLVAMQKSTEDTLKSYGCEMTALDSQLNPQTQVTQFQQLLAQHVKAIILMPVALNALQPSLAQAKEENIPVIGFNLPYDLSQPSNPLITTNVSTAFDFACYAVMRHLADVRPGSTFAIMGTAIPSDQLQYFIKRYQYWGEQLGLKFVGKVDALADDPNSFTPAIQSIFTKWPDVQNLVSYSETFALTASTVAAQAGKTDVNIVDSNGGLASVVPAIKAGKVLGNYFVPWVGAGQQMAYAAFMAVSGDEPPQTVVLRSKEVTKGNLNDFDFVE